jgi:DNA-binding NtrC family response regulator
MYTRWEAVILSTDLEWRHGLARILSDNGIDFAFATNVADCREIVAREYVGLIFWDSHLADGSYCDLLDSVQSLDRRVKIVVISHLDDWNRQLETARMGAFGVIPFPCQPTDVEWILSRAFRAERQEMEMKFDPVRELLPHF